MGGLTEQVPKPLLEVAGKTFLEHKFDILPDDVDEILLVVGHLGDKVRERYGEEYKGKRILYVEQGELNGTADALWKTQHLLNGKFLVLMGDDIYAREDIDSCRKYDWALLAKYNPDMRQGGKLIKDEAGNLADIVEGTEHDGPGLISTNMFVLDTRLFQYHQMVPKGPGSHEFGLPQTVLAASRASGIPLAIVEATLWIQITSVEDLKNAESVLLGSSTPK